MRIPIIVFGVGAVMVLVGIQQGFLLWPIVLVLFFFGGKRPMCRLVVAIMLIALVYGAMSLGGGKSVNGSLRQVDQSITP